MKEEQFIKIRTAVNSSLKDVLLNKSKDILNEENIQNLILRGEDRYATIINKPLCEIISKEKVKI